jgi:hypothetical protein
MIRSSERLKKYLTNRAIETLSSFYDEVQIDTQDKAAFSGTMEKYFWEFWVGL